MTKEEELKINKYDLLFESRLTRVETTMDTVLDNIKEVKTDLRWILGIWLLYSVGMLGLMAKGFHWF